MARQNQSSAEPPCPVRLHARTAVVDPTPELMKGLGKLFGGGGGGVGE